MSRRHARLVDMRDRQSGVLRRPTSARPFRGFALAHLALGLARDELKDEFAEYLHDVMAMRKAAE